MTRRFLISFPFLALPMLAEDSAWLTRLGGQSETGSSGRITSVNLRGSWINDVEMLEIARLEGLKRLDLSHTRITDVGLLYIKNHPTVEDLNLE
jgi:hypothetical protein